MSLLPLLISGPSDYCSRPSRILNQYFGLDLEPEDLFSPIVPRDVRGLTRCPAGYVRPWTSLASRQDVGSTVNVDKDKFQANLDVGQFGPDEISVRVAPDENTVTIEGKHEEKRDEHGFISRHFVRKYVLPRGHDVDKIESELSSDGVLTITAPRVDVDREEGCRSVPITQTGKPSKPIENKESPKED